MQRPTGAPRLFVITFFGGDSRPGDPPIGTAWGHAWADRALVSWRLPGTADRQIAEFSSAEAAEQFLDRLPGINAHLTWPRSARNGT